MLLELKPVVQGAVVIPQVQLASGRMPLKMRFWRELRRPFLVRVYLLKPCLSLIHYFIELSRSGRSLRLPINLLGAFPGKR